MTDFQGDMIFEQEIEGWTTGEQAESIRNYSMDQLKKDVREMLKTVDCQSGIWIFGYGSLMWNPDVRYSKIDTGMLLGYHRRLCLRSTIYRGVPKQPGVVMGLAPGGTCHGRIFFIPRKYFSPDLLLLWDREMLAGTYLPKWVKIQKASETVDALTFIADPTHEDYLPPGDLKEIAMMVSRARGQRGTNLDYLRNTVEVLHQLELKDSGLETILDLATRKADLHLAE
ncbi:MAG: gamma-glutamylcyclotransferase [SAR324 cluster bacterium]|jgi:cation transport protein ChaC|nr:gamma-glutamylcyclotransferase [SAR324 cluster bacterium]